MIVGLPKEVQDHEYRAALTPAGAKEVVAAGSQVVVERGVGVGSGFEDEAYTGAGAKVVGAAAQVWRAAELVVKVKEPGKEEFPHLRPGLTLFTYLHTPPRRELTQQLLDRKVIAIAYENVTAPDGSRPLLAPMSEIAGKLAVFIGAQYLQKLHGGAGLLLARVTGLRPPAVLILGGGVAGTAAAFAAAGLGCDVYVLELSPKRIRDLTAVLPPPVKVLPVTKENVSALVKDADMVINCTVWPNPLGEHLVRRAMLPPMKRSAVIVDVSADPRGSIETSEHRTHSSPAFVADGILHFCVPNRSKRIAAGTRRHGRRGQDQHSLRSADQRRHALTFRLAHAEGRKRRKFLSAPDWPDAYLLTIRRRESLQPNLSLLAADSP